jgi:hypothetical protein
MTTEPSHPERETRAAKNESLFREVNEREMQDSRNGLWLTFLCECADEACEEGIELTPEEYEAVRTKPTLFAVAPRDEHTIAEVEHVAAKHQRYWIVEKVGEAAAVAEKLDPRSR